MDIGPRPTVYELNTAVWLSRLGREHGGAITLDAVPAAQWDALEQLGVDAVWLMGVWQRSPEGLRIALSDPALDAGNRASLPDMRPEDVIGSPYCVRDYVVDERFGGPAALAAARAALAQRGLALILDYVPNHVAPDHAWIRARPECFLSADDEELAHHPEAFIRAEGGIFARGRDPYFPPWPDVVQLNAFSPALRDAVTDTLVEIGDQCDGLRCDMAMLMTNEVFTRTWGDRAGPVPDEDYWPTVIARVKRAHPHLLFMAEAYWDMEWNLQQQGFDLCYDKRLYDRLLHDSPAAVTGHLEADSAYQERLIRFIENHDEPRAAAVFGPAQARAAAVVMSTLQGARLYHDGQFEGRRIHVSVFLARAADEPVDEQLRSFYLRLLRAVADSGLQQGEWQLCSCEGWPDNDSAGQLLAWCWRTPASRHLVVINDSDRPAQGRVLLPWDDLAGHDWRLQEQLGESTFLRAGDELAAEGLYVALDGWGCHFLRATPVPAGEPAERVREPVTA